MLQGVKVIEFASVVAAPSAGGLLADWGADVVKIEPHAGDSMRGRPGSPLGSTNFDIHNRNKRGIALNTNAPDTQEVLLRLVAGADIFLTNMLPSRLEKIGMDWNSLHAVNPAMVYGAVSSFGWNGPDR
ncbi:MAG: CoA transferase, partial [Hyphomonas sp.]|nr:CoA transferase [Hyphomonas sp.]